MGKKIEYLIIHCTATTPYREVTKEDIEKWHLIDNDWTRLGYSDLINLKGELITLTDWNQNGIIENHEMTWGAKGINAISMHVVYAGGLNENHEPEDTRTGAQFEAMLTYINFVILRWPWIKIAGHNKFSNKACPSFDVSSWLKDMGVSDINIG